MDIAIYIVSTITFFISLSAIFKISKITEKVEELEVDQKNQLYLIKQLTDLMCQLVDRK